MVAEVQQPCESGMLQQLHRPRAFASAEAVAGRGCDGGQQYDAAQQLLRVALARTRVCTAQGAARIGTTGLRGRACQLRPSQITPFFRGMPVQR